MCCHNFLAIQILCPTQIRPPLLPRRVSKKERTNRRDKNVLEALLPLENEEETEADTAEDTKKKIVEELPTGKDY